MSYSQSKRQAQMDYGNLTASSLEQLFFKAFTVILFELGMVQKFLSDTFQYTLSFVLPFSHLNLQTWTMCMPIWPILKMPSLN